MTGPAESGMWAVLFSTSAVAAPRDKTGFAANRVTQKECLRAPTRSLKHFPAPTVQSDSIADNLSKSGWSWGCVSAVDSRGRTIWIAELPETLLRGEKKEERKKSSTWRAKNRFPREFMVDSLRPSFAASG